MIQVVDFKFEHLKGLKISDPEERELAVSAANQQIVNDSALSFTVLGDGTPIFCGGVIPITLNRGHLWSHFSDDAGPYMTGIHRATKRFLEMIPFLRVEAVVKYDYNRGHRWMDMLGFRLEAERMVSFWRDDRDASLYARVV